MAKTTALLGIDDEVNFAHQGGRRQRIGGRCTVIIVGSPSDNCK